MAKTKRTPMPADESPANDDARYAALQREFAELGQQIAQTKTNWEDQAEADDAKKLLDRHKALAHRLYRPPTPADLIGKFFQDADTILTFAVARPIRPFIHCVKGDPGYSAEEKSLDDYRDKMADHGWKTDGFLKLLHEDADRLADALASIGEDCKPVLEFCQMIPVSPGGHFLFKTAPVWAKLRELWPWLEGIRRRIVANDPLPAEDRALPPAEAVKADAAVTQAGNMSKEARALAVKTQHPDWTDAQVAEAAGCHVKSLYRWKLFTTAKGILQSGRADLPLGRKPKDKPMEAWEDATNDDDDKDDGES